MSSNYYFRRDGRRCGLGLVWVLLALLVGSPVLAGDSYLAGSHLDPVALLAPPPLPGSEEQLTDMASVVAAFHGRSHEEEVEGLQEEKFDVFTFGPVIGPFFQPGRLPKTEALFAEVEKESIPVTTEVKKYWKRPRPCVVDTNLAVGDLETSFSYPSGHATGGTIYALLLADMFPAKREAILAFARDLAWHRVLLAKHYPTDIYAGRVLGQAVVRELKASSAFQHDFAEAQAEVAQAGH
jgi:acid phosphatase (class A)